MAKNKTIQYLPVKFYRETEALNSLPSDLDEYGELLIPKRGKKKKTRSRTVAEKKHLDLIASLPCVACEADGYKIYGVHCHHITGGGMGKKSSDFETIPLCPDHHQFGMNGKIALHRGQETFEARYGTQAELLEKTKKNLEELKKCQIL